MQANKGWTQTEIMADRKECITIYKNNQSQILHQNWSKLPIPQCQTNDCNSYFKENPSGSDFEVFLLASAVCFQG